MSSQRLKEVVIETIARYQAQKCVRIVLLLLAPAAVWLALGAKLLAHSGAVVIHLSCAKICNSSLCWNLRVCGYEVGVFGVLRLSEKVNKSARR